MPPDLPEIAYILKGYLRTSETFITSEISLLEQAGVPLSVFSLLRLEGQQRHGVAGRIKAEVTYLPQTTPTAESGLLVWLWQNLPAFMPTHWRLVRARPGAWWRVLRESLTMAWQYRQSRFALNRTFIKEFLQAGFIAQRVLDAGRIRHLHAHFCHTATTVAMFASALCGLPFSFTAHAKDIYREDMNPGDLLTVKMRRARFVITCTGANQQYLERLNKSSTPVYKIYHGLDLALFSSAASAQKADGQTQSPLILSVGRLVEKKGFNYLIEACRMLKDRGCDFQCRIVGGAGSEAEHLRQLIAGLQLADRVTLAPAVTQEQLRLIYQQADLFALPCQVLADGDRDGIPNVLVEAMAMKLPVVSTDISGIPELIIHRHNGWLVPSKDAAALAGALEELLRNPGLRAELATQARATVVHHFDATVNVQQLRQLFAQT